MCVRFVFWCWGNLMKFVALKGHEDILFKLLFKFKLPLALLDTTTHCIQMIVSWSIFLIPCQFYVEFYLSAFEGKAMTKNCVRLKAFILLRALSAWLRQRLECTWLIGARGFGKCCANRLPKQYHDSRYVHWIRRIYTRAVDLATRPSRLFSSHFPLQQNEVWKRKWSVAQNNLKPFLCTPQWFCLLVSLTFSTIYQQPDSRILESSSLNFILFEPTKRDLNTTQK